jgi:DNA ligase 1
MQAFAALYERLDQASRTLDKLAALAEYWRAAEPADAAWALHILCGGRLKKIAASGELRRLIGTVSELPPWLIEDSYAHVGDLAETLTLLHDEPHSPAPAAPLSVWIEQRLLPLQKLVETERFDAIAAHWAQLERRERLVYNKLLTGALRVGVSQGLVQRSLAELSGLPIDVVAHRMMGGVAPSAEAWAALIDPAIDTQALNRPYPFFLASPLEGEVVALGPVSEWLIEWKWDGIRAQALKRRGSITLWSRGEERLDGRFPELERALEALAQDAVLDGEILAWSGAQPAPFTALQRRIGKLKPSAKLIAEVPVRLIAYDLLELNGVDLRTESLSVRRAHLTALLADAPSALEVSAARQASDWLEAARWREDARAAGVEGLMLKRVDSRYQAGRRRGDWWKWKLDPLSIDAVLIYAQAGHGRRATLYTDYTFALWDGDKLVAVAKAYSGLDDREITELDKWIRQHTRERFGPVRSVEPALVFELGFEAINASTRHKSGVAVRFPRILRWRRDKPISEANTLAELKALAQ